MSVEVNHTIVLTRDRERSARFLAEILGLEVGEPAGLFLPVSTTNGVATSRIRPVTGWRSSPGPTGARRSHR
ncbi:hypothetical protein SUDANB132_00776 [Streptomyces sp. enrichment culture]